MKKTVRINESQLRGLIKKALKEQEDQYMSGVDPENISGEEDTEPTPEDTEPNYDEFLTSAHGLISQGITIGNLIDKLLEGENTPDEETPEEEPSV